MNLLQVRLDPGPRAAGVARAALRAAKLVDRVPAALRGDLELLVTEVVTNSVRHADDGAVALDVQVAGERVKVNCCDGGFGFDGRPREPSIAGGGFGLVLVDRIASRWGVRRPAQGPGCCVWFELAAG